MAYWHEILYSCLSFIVFRFTSQLHPQGQILYNCKKRIWDVDNSCWLQIYSIIIFLLSLQGQFFSGADQRIYLLGNPIIWWGNLGFLAAFLVLYLVQSIKEQRGITQETLDSLPNNDQTLFSCIWLFIGNLIQALFFIYCSKNLTSALVTFLLLF